MSTTPKNDSVEGYYTAIMTVLRERCNERKCYVVIGSSSSDDTVSNLYSKLRCKSNILVSLGCYYVLFDRRVSNQKFSVKRWRKIYVDDL